MWQRVVMKGEQREHGAASETTGQVASRGRTRGPPKAGPDVRSAPNWFCPKKFRRREVGFVQKSLLTSTALPEVRKCAESTGNPLVSLPRALRPWGSSALSCGRSGRRDAAERCTLAAGQGGWLHFKSILTFPHASPRGHFPSLYLRPEPTLRLGASSRGRSACAQYFARRGRRDHALALRTPDRIFCDTRSSLDRRYGCTLKRLPNAR